MGREKNKSYLETSAKTLFRLRQGIKIRTQRLLLKTCFLFFRVRTLPSAFPHTHVVSVTHTVSQGSAHMVFCTHIIAHIVPFAHTPSYTPSHKL